MTAREDFERIGYKLKLDSNQYLIYARNCYDGVTGEFISFRKHQKKFGVFSVSASENRNTRMADLEELRAIIKQCKELWGEEYESVFQR